MKEHPEVLLAAQISLLHHLLKDSNQAFFKAAAQAQQAATWLLSKAGMSAEAEPDQEG